MIKETKAFTVQCDECKTWIFSKYKRAKLFPRAIDAKAEAREKGWIYISYSDQWICPRCDRCNRVTPYVYGGKR